MANNTISILIKAKDEASPVFRSTVDSLQSVGDSASRVGSNLTRALTLPIAGVGAASIKMAGDFEQSLNILQSVTGATADQMASLQQQAKDLGKDISLPGVSAKDAALAMTELAKAGISVNDTMTASKGVLSLAKAGQVETAFAAEVTANALNAFSLAGTEASKVADMLAGGANGSSASIEDLSLGMQMASAGAATLKMPIGDLISALGLMSNNAIKGSDAGTSLKTFMNSLTPTTEKAAGAMKDMNLRFYDAKGNFVGLRDAARQLQEGTKNMTTEQKLFNMEAAFGSDAMRAGLVLSKEGAAGYDKLAASVNKQGAATELAAAQNKGFNGALDNLKSTAETAMIEIGSDLLPLVTQSLKDLTTQVSRVSDWFNGLSKEQQGMIFKTISMIAILGPAVFITGKFAQSIATVTKVVGGASKALGLFKTAGFVSKVGGATSILGRAGLVGAAGSATTALVGSGGLMAALGPVGLAIAGTALVAGGAYLAYKKFNEAADDTTLATQGAYTPVSMLALAEGRVALAKEDVTKKSDAYTQATRNLIAAQKDSATAQDAAKAAAQRVDAAQKIVADTLAQFGINSPQYQQAVADLKLKQDDLNRALADTATNNLAVSSTSFDVWEKLGEQALAVDALRDAENGLNTSLHGTVDKIKEFGPAAAGQVQSIAELQLSVSGVITSWGGFYGNVQAQNAEVNSIFRGTSGTIDRLQTQGGNLVKTLQSASSIQIGAGAGLQGSTGRPKHALGTNYAPGGSTLVGEHGPEIVNLPRGSKVSTAEESRGSLGQTITNVLSGTFTFQNAEAVGAFWDRLDKTQRLARIGMA